VVAPKKSRYRASSIRFAVMGGPPPEHGKPH
jgi:hypothetical protein